MLVVEYTFFFFFNDTATTEIYTLSLHDALPICAIPQREAVPLATIDVGPRERDPGRDRQSVHIAEVNHIQAGLTRHATQDRKSTRLNSSHSQISYAVFCLKKKKKKKQSHNSYI